MQTAPRAIIPPATEIMVDRAPRWQISRVRTPLAASAQHIHQTIDHRAHVNRSSVTAALDRRDLRFHPRPFLIGQEASRLAGGRRPNVGLSTGYDGVCGNATTGPASPPWWSSRAPARSPTRWSARHASTSHRCCLPRACWHRSCEAIGIGRSRTACSRSSTWWSAMANAGSAPITPQPTSVPSSTWRRT